MIRKVKTEWQFRITILKQQLLRHLTVGHHQSMLQTSMQTSSMTKTVTNATTAQPYRTTDSLQAFLQTGNLPSGFTDSTSTKLLFVYVVCDI